MMCVMTENSTTFNVTVSLNSIYPHMPLFTLGFVGNVIALVSLLKSFKAQKWRSFHRLIFALSLTDFCAFILQFPSFALRHAHGLCSDFPKKLCHYSSFIFAYTLLSSAFIVCVLSMDRFVAILYPILYKTASRARIINGILTTICVISGIISSLHLYGIGNSHVLYPGTACFLNYFGHGKYDRVDSFVYSLTGIFILIVTMVLNLTVIVHLIRKMIVENHSRLNKKLNDIYIIIYLFVIVAVFCICLSPLMINILEHATLTRERNGSVELNVIRLALTNPLINPWIYILLRRRNLRNIHRRLKRWKRTRGNDMSSNDHNDDHSSVQI